MELKEIQELIKFVYKSGVSEVSMEQGDFKITIKTGSGETRTFAAPVHVQHVPAISHATQPQEQHPAPPTSAPAVVESVSNTVNINSPMIGTFYRRPSPDKEPFVKVGDMVKKGQVVCVIEAMKLFNEIESDVAGKVVKILPEDVSPVEFDQPLFVVEPA